MHELVQLLQQVNRAATVSAVFRKQLWCMTGGVCCLRRRGEWWTRLSLDLEHLGRPDQSLEVSTLCPWCHTYTARHDLESVIIVRVDYIIVITSVVIVIICYGGAVSITN